MKVSYNFFKEYPQTRLLITKMMEGKYPTVKSSYRIKKIVDSLSLEFEIYRTLLKEREEIIVWEDKKVVNNDEVNAAFAEFFEHEFELDFNPLDLGELESIPNVTPIDISLLKMISEPKAFDSLLD